MLAKTRKYSFATILLIIWMILMLSAIGHIVAGVTIFFVVGMLFVCGFISVDRRPDKF